MWLCSFKANAKSCTVNNTLAVNKQTSLGIDNVIVLQVGQYVESIVDIFHPLECMEVRDISQYSFVSYTLSFKHKYRYLLVSPV